MSPWLWAAIGGLGAGFLFGLWIVLLTDGRWFGKGLIYRVYDRAGPDLFASMPETERWLALLARLDLRGDERVLDVGTAVGHLPLTLAARPSFRGRVTGVDWSPRMVERARAEARRRGLDGQVDFRVADVRAGLPFADHSFNVVVCLGVLEAQPRTASVLAELARLVVPGGALALSLYRDLSARLTGIDAAWYERHLKALGFHDLKTVPFRRSHDVLIARRQTQPVGA